LSENCKKKFQHEKCTILLDDCFCNDDVAAILSEAGFMLEQFTTYFPRTVGREGVREQGVKDPRVIALSHKLKMVVFTTDHKMCNDHGTEFTKHPNAMVVATAHRNASDEVWARAFIKAKPKIEQFHKKKGRPWFAKINQNGEVTKSWTFATSY
jgi:hypothetical protein